MPPFPTFSADFNLSAVAMWLFFSGTSEDEALREAIEWPLEAEAGAKLLLLPLDLVVVTSFFLHALIGTRCDHKLNFPF